MAMDGSGEEMPRASMTVDYRHCAELQEAIALGAVIRPMGATDGAAVARRDRPIPAQAPRVAAQGAQRRLHLQEPPGQFRRPPHRRERAQGRPGRRRRGVPGSTRIS